MTTRLVLDEGKEMSIASLRMVAGLVVGALSVFLLALPLGTAPRVLAGVALAVSIAWIVVAARGRRRIRSRDAWWVELGDELAVAQGGDPAVISWRDIARVDVDEERLDVVVHRATGGELRILPVWRGADGPLGLHDVADVIVAAWEDAKRRDHG